MRQSPDINEIPARIRFPYMCSISSFSQTLMNQHKANLRNQWDPQLKIRCPCYSNSFINTLEEGNLGNQSKRDYDFAAATVKVVFRGQKWQITGGGLHIYIYRDVHDMRVRTWRCRVHEGALQGGCGQGVVWDKCGYLDAQLSQWVHPVSPKIAPILGPTTPPFCSPLTTSPKQPSIDIDVDSKPKRYPRTLLKATLYRTPISPFNSREPPISPERGPRRPFKGALRSPTCAASGLRHLLLRAPGPRPGSPKPVDGAGAHGTVPAGV